MRIKADENIGRGSIELLRASGHDVMTVREQSLAGEPDERVYRVCRMERRVLLTLDRGFGEPLRFPSAPSAGIVILEIGAPASLRLLADRIQDFLTLAEARSAEGELWIVEPGRIRIRSSDRDIPTRG